MDSPLSLGGHLSTPVSYLAEIRAAASDPERLEALYQSARASHTAERFTADIFTAYQEAPENLLFAAWYHRLRQERQSALRTYLGIHWPLAVPLSLALAVVFWLLSDPRYTLGPKVPVLAVVWAPLAALALIGFLVGTARRGIPQALVASLALIGVTAYGLVVVIGAGEGAAPATIQAATPQQQYLPLLLLHLPLLSAAAVGIALLGWRAPAENRFAFLVKSLETIGTAGVASIVGGIFVGLTIGIFQALSITLPDVLLRLLIVGGAGLIPVLAVASVYDPTLAPSEQDFRRGFGRLLTTLLRALLAPTLVVLAIYLVVIPFNVGQPFTNRDVLIVYNVLLFAILGLLVGVIPVSADDLSPRVQRWLRAGVVALAGLVTLISLYALAAVLYRTSQGQLTMNRVTVIGWNVLNISLLILLLARQTRTSQDGWVRALHRVFGVGTGLYVAWGTLLVLALPIIFR